MCCSCSPIACSPIACSPTACGVGSEFITELKGLGGPGAEPFLEDLYSEMLNRPPMDLSFLSQNRAGHMPEYEQHAAAVGEEQGNGRKDRKKSLIREPIPIRDVMAQGSEIKKAVACDTCAKFEVRLTLNTCTHFWNALFCIATAIATTITLNTFAREGPLR